MKKYEFVITLLVMGFALVACGGDKLYDNALEAVAKTHSQQAVSQVVDAYEDEITYILYGGSQLILWLNTTRSFSTLTVSSIGSK